VFGCRCHEGPNWDWVENEIASAKWLTWHGKGRKAIARLNRLHSALEAWPEHWSSRLAWNVRIVRRYLEMNRHYLVNYGVRYRKGLPISSGIAESAVNQVASHRMAKKQQMRWSDDGAHCMVLIRVADINGELSPQSLAALPKVKSGAIPLERQQNALRMAA
jgi:hypothetical protein